jgi:dTDP-4-amino-4,6-dideoxygalactose transaminase
MHKQDDQTSIHFLPIHKFTAYKDESFKLPITEWVGEHIVSLPIYPQMTFKEVDHVCDAVIKSKLMIN